MWAMPKINEVNESDVLDEVLRSWQPQGQIFCHLELTGPWAFRMVGSGLARFHVVERGTCWVQTRANDSPIELAPGDLVVALHGHQLSHNARPRNINSLQTFLERLQHFSPIGFRKPGTGAVTHLLCGSFQLMHGVRHPLLTALPSVLHVKGHHGKPVDWLDNTLKLLRAEIAAGGVGSETIISRLTDLIFIQAVRAWIGQLPQDLVARLGALRDRHIGAALRLMHREPGRAWTVPSLARAVGLSRATLARRFTRVIGEPPLTYLGHWRMRLAADLIRSSDLTVAEIASAVGYQSEAALSRLFRRVMGLPPGAYRRVYSTDGS